MSFAERCFSSGYFENPVTCPHCHTEFEGPAPDEGEYLGRLRIEIVGALTAAGICMLVDADPTAYGEVRSAVKRLAAERDEAKNEMAVAVEHAGRLIRERNALREQTRVRDARVELPEDAETVLLWVEDGWRAVRYRAWGWSDGNDPADFPFWLPMPPDPEPH